MKAYQEQETYISEAIRQLNNLGCDHDRGIIKEYFQDEWPIEDAVYDIASKQTDIEL